MRMYSLLLAAAAALSAYADASLTRSSLTFERSAPAHQHDPPRFLRDGAEATEEERTFDLSELRVPLLEAKNDVEKNPNFKKLHDVLIYFKDDTGDNLLMYSKFEQWVKDMQKQYGLRSDAAIVELLGHFYNDHELLPMLEKSSKDPATKEIATKLQDKWITSKVKQAGIPTDEVIEYVLKLIDLDGSVVGSSRFEAYFKLMKRKHGTDADGLYRAMATGLGSRYGTNAAFLEMLKISTQDPATKDLAEKLMQVASKPSSNPPI